MDIYQQEIMGQPEALRRLAQYYSGGEGRQLFERLPPTKALTLTGMGASYHAAWASIYHAHRFNLRATAIEATDLIYFSETMLTPENPLVYLSQSGESGEVEPIVQRLASGSTLIGVTNAPDSRLARHAQMVFPLVAGHETLVASKTYLNSLALLWLLVRHWAGLSDGVSALNTAADTVERLLAQWETTTPRWLADLGSAATLVFLGHGPHAATARQAAMMVNEWAKVPAQSASIGAFQHGFIESCDSSMGAVIFAPPGAAGDSARRLAVRLKDYGARVLLVANGETLSLEQYAPAQSFDEFLSPILDIIPVQMFADALARQRQVTREFRHLSKVVTTL
jgi:glutamine---fructose-6-phosphate transaminase (isomerizing)